MINLLNLTDPEDAYLLISDIAEEARGRSIDEITQRQLEGMLLYLDEVNRWAQHGEDAEALYAGVAYNLELADLCSHLDEEEQEAVSIIQAFLLATKLMKVRGTLHDFELLCRVIYRRMNLFWYQEDEKSGKRLCHHLCAEAWTYSRAHPEWDRKGFLEELAKIYEENAKWYGKFSPEESWHQVCRIRGQRLRLYLARLQEREMLVQLRQDHFNAAGRYRDSYHDWDLKKARSHLNSALNLMKKHPKLPHTCYLRAAAYEGIAWTYVEEEDYARTMKLPFSPEKREHSLLRAKEYQVKALDAYLAWRDYLLRRGENPAAALEGLRYCYIDLADICEMISGEKNARKAEKYRRLAAKLEN